MKFSLGQKVCVQACPAYEGYIVGIQIFPPDEKDISIYAKNEEQILYTVKSFYNEGGIVYSEHSECIAKQMHAV